MSNTTPPRPLSPHLQIWRWHVTMLSSILHRVTGSASVAGIVLIAAWLICLALGRETYTAFLQYAASPLGLLVWFDLRLLGASMRGHRASAMYRRLAPWMFTGFAIMLATGLMLLAGYATSAYTNTYFRIKVAAMILAAINAFVYHRYTERHIVEWDEAPVPPTRARVAGLVSLSVWMIVIFAGRMMSYTMF